ncbi:YceI family protein [Blastococcus sp. CT_GayMR20]|uniref:YceI family protein n=1 Tax=Blastococcus sp. CT_GayMR20 TaxID=2559609 RepID=UPI001ADDCAED|nr:YceI family protein [Blastococcus sp. CT_GayMR20]
MTAQLRSLHPAAGTWSVSDSRTRVTFTVSNFGRPVHGSVTCSRGEVEVDDAGNPVRVRAELDLETLVTGIGKRDSDLRKPHFLDIDRQPVMTWAADRFTPDEEGRWTADGELSVRGVSAPLAVTGMPESAALDGSWVRVRATGAIDRTAVGIRAPRFLIGRLVGVEIDAWLTMSRRP